MTKKLAIPLVAITLFVLIAITPVSAVTTTNYNGNAIDAGATVFIGEQNLNLTHAMNEVIYGVPGPQANGTYDSVPIATKIGWWASAAAIGTTAPTKSIDIGPATTAGRYTNFQVAPADFVGYTGNWYLLQSDGMTPYPGAGVYNAVMNVQDPVLSVGVWDFFQGENVNGMSVPQGEPLGVLINTNMYVATFSSRNNTVWEITPNAPYPVLGTQTGPAIMPNGLVSSWGDTNYTGNANGSYVAVKNGNVWTINNYANITDPANGNSNVVGIYNQVLPINTEYSYLYWNNSPVVGSADGITNPISSVNWTAQNFTIDAAGLTPFYPAAVPFNNWLTNQVGTLPTPVDTTKSDSLGSD